MIAIGIGASSSAEQKDFVVALDNARRQAGGDVVVTFDTAAFLDHVRGAADTVALDFRPVALDAMRERNADCLASSERTFALFGVVSIAEAAALAGAGPGSRLVMPKQIVGRVTVAAAKSADEEGPRE